MKTQNLNKILNIIDNICYVEQEIAVKIEGSTSIYTLTLERDEGGLISDIQELKNSIYCDSEDIIIQEIFNTPPCMFEFDEQIFSCNGREQNKTSINKGDIDIYHLSDDDLTFLDKIGNEKYISLSWKLIENRIYLKDEDE